MTLPPDVRARQRTLKELPAYLPGYPQCVSGQAKGISVLLSQNNVLVGPSIIKPEVGASPRIVYEGPLDYLAHEHILLDISPTATPERYRLVDCARVVGNNTLCIYEFDNFPRVPYAAISYVWRGNGIDQGFSDSVFSVRGAEDADPIGCGVLHDACTASLVCGATHVWLDRLCIVQTSKQDKQWQIREMYRMYCFCTVCVVIPGGLQRLVSIEEETQWIHRGWTLQEVVAPPAVAVLFAWNHGPGEGLGIFSGETFYHEVEEVTPKRSAMASLPWILSVSVGGTFLFENRITVKSQLFGVQPHDHRTYLYDDQERVALPHIAALTFAMGRNLDTDEMKDYCIWQSALMRTSSRPVDMVFSIMGLFGVSLDPNTFDVNDRLGATIALARAILKEGRSASWLGVSYRVPPCKQLSTFPSFPQTSVAGKALLTTSNGVHEVWKLGDSDYPNEAALGPLPRGSMDEWGYHTFEASAVSLVLAVSDEAQQLLRRDARYDDASKPTLIRAVDGSLWNTCLEAVSERTGERSQADPPVRSFAISLGFYNTMPAGTSGDNVRAMLVQEHAPGKFHVRSYFVLSYQCLEWVTTWSQYQFCVGGPEELTVSVTTTQQGDRVAPSSTPPHSQTVTQRGADSVSTRLRRAMKRLYQWLLSLIY